MYYSPQHKNDLNGEKIGVLLLNLGTPDAPTKQALKPYLREFLWDSRVIEPPPARWIWWLILNGIILNKRPGFIAEEYKEIWDSEGPGAPLLRITERQMEGVKKQLVGLEDYDLEFEIGMRYGNPSIQSALENLDKKGIDRLLVLPLYPQYCASTTASTFDKVTDVLRTWRKVPELRFINRYYQNPGYIKSLANSIREHQAEHGKPQMLVLSYHGTLQRYIDNGDPYFEECHETTRLLAEEMGWQEGEYLTTFQSIFGNEPWIKPYTDATMKSLPGKGIKDVQVICPGFSADCLETIEEIDEENREYFEEAGGEKFSYICALNDREDHLAALADEVKRHLKGWEKA